MYYVLTDSENNILKYPYTIGMLRKDNPMTSFPKQIAEQTLNDFGVFRIAEVKPEITSNKKLSKPSQPVYQEGQWKLIWTAEDKTPEEIEATNTPIAEAKKREIREAFAVAASADVTDLQGVTWRGGLQSAQSIAGAVDLAQVAGLAEITLRDAERRPHVVDMATGLQVAAEIAMAYQSAFQKKEDLMLQIESIDLKQTTAETEINSIVWENQNA